MYTTYAYLDAVSTPPHPDPSKPQYDRRYVYLPARVYRARNYSQKPPRQNPVNACAFRAIRRTRERTPTSMIILSCPKRHFKSAVKWRKERLSTPSDQKLIVYDMFSPCICRSD
ncbi:unnamed protein product [Blumeria hordei]|uniref:Uncharacterized protein n=1 Tax=Blumeria hordei TaxID=2867405 RepID=A0A383UP21_BLUHO|nr:unnamed protein product [Blumeria hordei]